jgi:ABC-type dipeptide/oligopeptide/nickel transport system permease component
LQGGFTPNPVDYRLFWMVLYGFPVAWIVLMIVCIFGFKLLWLPLVTLSLTLTMANAIGYTKCDKDAKKKLNPTSFENIGTVLNFMNRFNSK